MATPSVTAARKLQPASLAPGSVTVITRQEMARNGWRSVEAVLANTPGVYVTSDGSITSVSVRGVTGGLQGGTRLLKVMINGTPVNFRPELRAFVGQEFIPFEAIERIEIVYGALSALYGPNAALATVNVITREVAPGGHASVSGAVTGHNENRSGFGGSGVVMYGGEFARMILGATSSRIDRSRLRVSRTFDAQDPTLPRFAPFFRGSSDDDISLPAGAFVQIAVPSSSAGTLTFDGGLQRLDSNAEFRPNSVLTHQSRESLYNVWSNLRHQNDWTKAVSSELNIGYSAGEPTRDDRFFLQGVLDQTYTRNYGYRAFSAAAAVDVTPIPQFSARLGLEAELELHDILFYTVTYSAAQGMREAGESVDQVPESVDTTQTVSNRAAYLTLSGQPLPMFEALRLTGSVRLDSTAYGDTDLDSMFSARAAAVVEVFPWLVTKLSYGRGFNVPSAVLMFAQIGFGSSNILTGNLAAPSGAPPMEPQRVDSFEAGVHLAVWDAAVLQLTAFHQKVTGRIEFAWNGSVNFIGRNTDDQTLIGGEAAIRTTLGPVNPFVSAALVKTEEEPLVAYPGFVGALGVDVALFSKPSLYFNGRVQHVGARAATQPHVVLNGGDGYELPAYQTVDLSLSLDELPLFGRELNTQVVASARNVFDQRHSEPGFVGFDVPALGRTAFIEVRQSF